MTTKGTRERMVEAAERVMQSKGLARTTTKEIAREAGFSEGTIYKHFESKEELFIAVLTERQSPFVGIMVGLPQRAGEQTPRALLVEVASAALPFYSQTIPMSASIFSEPALLARHRAEMQRTGAGPQNASKALVAYLLAERDLGRVRKDADLEASAAMLLGACFQRAFLANFWGEDDSPAQREEFVQNLMQMLMRILDSGDE